MHKGTVFSALSLVVVLAGACSSNEGPNEEGPPVDPREGGAVDQDSGVVVPGSTDIVFADDTTFSQRDCSVVLRYGGAAADVKVAGEFTDWAASPLTMTKSGSAFELTISPGAKVTPGELYAYKLVVDGSWIVDPASPYRKIVDGQMNAGLRLPACQSGPELIANRVAVTATGTMNVRVSVKSATAGAKPRRMTASLDHATLPQGSWTIDKTTGAVDFALSGIEKGKHTLSVKATDADGREAAPIDLPFWIEDEPFDSRDGILYMFMVDRFANGNAANDQPVGGPVHYDADWHGGDLEGALAVMKTGYFEKLGAKTLWLSPLNMQTSKSQSGDGGQTYSAYHGYWPIKAREVEPRFGGAAALNALVTEAHKRGLRVILDLINNQVHEDHEYLASHSDWFRKSCQCGDNANGCGWSQRPFDCMFQPYLPDIDWTKSGAEHQFIDDAVSWLTTFDLDGFRVDAVKHVEANAIYNMRAELKRRFEQGGARIFMVGETAVGEGDSGTFFGESFSDGFAWVDAYTGPFALDGQFDFPTRHNMADGLVNGLRPFDQIEGDIQKALTRYRPDNRHVRFLNGHDNPRIASIAAEDPKVGCSWAGGCRDAQLPPVAYTDPAVYVKLKRALTALYTIPGVPYLYAGDEVAFPGGLDPDMRRNMRFEEAELATTQMTKAGVAVNALNAQQIDLRNWTRKLGETRANSRALRRGGRKTLIGNDANLWVYAFEAGPSEVAIVVLNRGGTTTREFSGANLGIGGVTGWKSPLGTGTLTAAGANLSVTIGAGEAAIFVPN